MTINYLPVINYELCIACGFCVITCTAGALDMNEEGPYFSAPQNCTYCTDCEISCPKHAISCDFEISWGSETDPGRPS